MKNKNKQSAMRDCYHYYIECSFSPFPISEEHELQIVDRNQLQRGIPTEAEVESWLEDIPHSNIGINTGKISNLIVVEIQNESREQIRDIFEDLFHYPTVQTPAGYHFYMKYQNCEIYNCSNIMDGIDIHSDGSYVIAPPSKDEDGVEYSWLTTIEDAGGIPDTPESLLTHFMESRDDDFFY
jgi:hypothetical protein